MGLTGVDGGILFAVSQQSLCFSMSYLFFQPKSQILL